MTTYRYKMYIKILYTTNIVLVICHHIMGKFLPNTNNLIAFRDGENHSEENVPMNTNSPTQEEGYYSVDQDHDVSHVCIYEHWLKNELIICDRRQASIFACIGAIEGEIKLCEKSTRNEIFVPVCVNEKTSQMITCKYKELLSRQLCFPRASSFKTLNHTLLSNIIAHIPFRVCKNKKRFSCLKNGNISLCNQPGVGEIVPESKITESQYEKSCNSSTPGNDCISSDDHKGSNQKKKTSKKKTNEDGKTNSHNKAKQETTTIKQEESKENKKNSTIDSIGQNSHKHPNKAKNKKEIAAHRKSIYQPTRKRKHGNTSPADKNKRKRTHKVLKHGSYKKIVDNYDKGKHKKNTRKHKSHSLKSINVTNKKGGQKVTVKDKTTTGIPRDNEINKYFQVFKCDDCSIDHVIKVEEDAYSVKVWTLPTN